MIEIITIILLMAYIGYKEYVVGRERKELIDRIMAKNLTELRDLKMADNVKIEVQKEPSMEAISESSDEEFMLGIKQELGRDDKGIKKLKDLVRKKQI
jgi:uncharacterized protein (UPF0305 family)